MRLGISFRGKISGEEEDGIAVVLPKNVNEGRVLEPIARLHEQEVVNWQRHLLRLGDVLLSNKGDKFSTFRYVDEPERVVASSSFFVLRPDPAQILPAYLEWCLAQPEVEKQLQALTTTSTIPTLSKRSLEALELKVPALKTQQKIVEMLTLVEEERQQLLHLVEVRQAFRDAYCWELIQKGA